MLKGRKRALAVLLLVSILISAFHLFGCASENGEPSDVTPVEEPPKYEIRLAALGEAVEIHTEEQADYLKDDPANITAHIPEIANTERSYPKEVELSWSVDGNEVSSSTQYRISVSTSPTMSNAKTDTTTDTRYSVANLRIGTTYYWTVSFAEDGVTYESDVASFTTTGQGPRNLKVEGVTNVRDTGGWKTADGKTVKQGMIFRTARLDPITEAGRKVMLEDLGIRTEIDLRQGMSKSVLEGVNFLNYGCSDGASLIDLRPVLPRIFEALADESNYPIFFHCNIGTDRTGGVVFLINALLGVSEDDLYYDYCFSNFGKIASDDATSFTPRTPEYLQNKITFFFTRTPGKTLQEKVWNYLLSIGISEATLNEVVRIMTE